jgi:hypothetical protein
MKEWRDQYDPEAAKKRRLADASRRTIGPIYNPYFINRPYRRPQTWLAKPMPVGDLCLLVAYIIAVLTLIAVVALY